MVAHSLSATCSNAIILAGMILGLVASSTAFFVEPPGRKLATAAIGNADLETLGFSTTWPSDKEAAPGEEARGYRGSKGELDDGSMDYILENNREWIEQTLARDPNAFKRLAKSQSPKYLYIGCSDSRVPAQNIMGLNMGDLFVVRNVANLCVNTDHSLLAALVYAVNVLEVTDIIVCGHYGCGGVRAAMENTDHGLLEHWLLNIRDVRRLHQEELETIQNIDERHRRFVELNVQESCINLFANPVVQKKQAKSSTPKIHGLVYDVATGLLKKLDIDFKSEINRYQSVYRLYGSPRSPTKEKNVGMVLRRKGRGASPVSNTPPTTSPATSCRTLENSRAGK